MYVVIVGAGEIGEKLASIALKNKDDVVVIEKDKEKCDEISKKYDAVVINADATVKETLEDAGVDKADSLVTTADDATNLMVISLAKTMGVSSLVALVRNEESRPMFQEKGANVVGNPSVITAEYLYRAIRHPTVIDFMTLGDKAEIFKLVIPFNSTVIGKSIGEIKLPSKVSIIAIERDGEVIIPMKDTRFRENDSVTILARKDKIDKTTGIFFTKK